MDKASTVEKFVKILSSLKFQITFIFILLLVRLYSLIFNSDFISLKNCIKKILPIGVINTLQDLCIPLLKIFSILSIFGFIVLFLLLIIFGVKDNFKLFSNLDQNLTNILSRGGGLLELIDSTLKLLIITPTNLFTMITLITFSFIDNNTSFYYLFTDLFSKYTFVMIEVGLAAILYIIFIVSLFTNNEN